MITPYHNIYIKVSQNMYYQTFFSLYKVGAIIIINYIAIYVKYFKIDLSNSNYKK